MKKSIKLFFTGLFVLYSINSLGQQEIEIVNENFQSWAEIIIWNNFDADIIVGNRIAELSMTQCTSFPEDNVEGDASEGHVRVRETTGIIEFPELPSVTEIELGMSTFSSEQETIELQIFVDGSWEFEQTFAGITDESNSWTYSIDSDEPITLRLANASDNINIHDIIVRTETHDLPLYEDFSGFSLGEIPSYWQRDVENFGVQNTEWAGGETPEMAFGSAPNDVGVFYLVSPFINATDSEAIEFSFKSLVNHDSGDYTLRVVALADGDEFVIEEWINPTANIAADEYEYILTNEDHGISTDNFQIAFVFDGNTENINWWFIDDISLQNIENYKFIPYFEDFSDVVGDIPEGWSRDVDNFRISNTNEAGGEEPEMEFFYDPMVDGEFYLISPLINTSGYDRLSFSYKNFLNATTHPDSPYEIEVVTIADGDEFPVINWSTPGGGLDAEELQFILTNEDHGVGAENFRLAFKYDGASREITYWRFDDILLQEVYTVTFEVEDESGSVIDDAVITFNSIENDAGDYDFEDITEGNYNFTVERSGYDTYVDDVFIDSDTVIEIELSAAEDLYELSIQVQPEHGGNASGEGDYPEGEEVTITATPNTGWAFVNWTGDTQNVDDVNSQTTTVTMPSNNIIIIANFTDDVIYVEYLQDIDIKVYPNPAYSDINIQSNEIIDKINIVNTIGQVVFSKNINASEHIFNIEQLDKGTYFIQIYTNEMMFTKSFQVIK